jgi:hypothetical protein
VQSSVALDFDVFGLVVRLNALMTHDQSQNAGKDRLFDLSDQSGQPRGLWLDCL